jgi:hypothetical protein
MGPVSACRDGGVRGIGRLVALRGRVRHALYHDRTVAAPPSGAARGTPAVDCNDRLALWLAELTLERVRTLGDRVAPASVTVRARLGQRRFEVTIAKLASERGADGVYRWDVCEVARPETGREGSVPLTLSSGDARYGDSEAAYWAAWGELDVAKWGSA